MTFEIANIIAPVWLPLVWGLFVGFVFSTVGAAGGILASFGLISVLGLQNANLVKPMAQTLTLVTPLIAVPIYFRQRRLVISLALILGAGGVFGAIIGSSLSVSHLSDMQLFKPVFGILVLVIVVQIAWQLVGRKQVTEQHTLRASLNFEHLVDQGGAPCSIGVKQQSWSFDRINFIFAGENFSYNPWLPFFTGMGIAIISSAFGVGGGFLLVPYMSIIMRLPMFIIAGTSALAIAIHSISSIANYMRLGVELDYSLLALLLSGTAIGAFVGPLLSKFLRESWLRAILCIVLLFIGLWYLGIAS
ncbi:MAG TPA: sulfite exporter TauE/SafE family protein [Gammaproteobacteria bacterium]|nr:sulfite exporter TauE/SafE family protein [Gammaproteobacteria bacterium]